ncbi:MAG: hypothetical protein QGG40_02845 [Myxococcota bacterium]|nr:hypothetical protein [Myxococcota bacterium]
MYRQLALVSLVLAGCPGIKLDDTGTTDTGETQTDDTGDSGTNDTAWYDGDVIIESYSWTCDESNYYYDTTTSGWTGGAWLDIHQTAVDASAAWTEEHWMESTDYGEYGYWDYLALTLPITDDWSVQESSVNTLYSCDSDAMYDTLSWRLTVYEYDSDVAADCIAWGDDPTYYSDCEDASSWR